MFGRFQTRSSETERLDRGEFTSAEYDRWHKEMWYIHRFFGEIRALKRSVIEAIKHADGRPVSVLDVAAGSGELLDYIDQHVAADTLFTVGAESSHPAARSIASKGIEAVQCDALALPFAPASFDIVFCTLFLHHLDEDRAASALTQMASIARRRLFVIDLDRRPLPYFAYNFFGKLFLQKFTRDDGALSILRAYSEPELERIASRAGINNFEIKRSAINRLIFSAKV